MSETKFTKGEWSLPHFADEAVDCNCGSVLSEGYFGAIATVHIDNGKCVSQGGNDCPPLEEAKANAHLIAAAPDLYAALEALQRRIVEADLWHGQEDELSAASAALAKARGEA